MSNQNSIYYFAFCTINVVLLKEVNQYVVEPYMVRQTKIYCTLRQKA